MICQKTLKIAMGVSMVLCATVSFAARTESFEAALDGSIWSGDITDALVTGTPTEPAVGFPIATKHTQVLNVEGSVICSNAGSGTSSISDFLIYIPELSDELGTDELDGAKVAIAAGTELSDGKIPLMLYCTNNNEAAWVQIATVESNTWLRVTLVFKDDRCRVSLDGEPVVNAFGYAASSGDTTGGAWYKLAGSGNSVQSLSFIGCAKLDDVVIKDSFAEDAFPATAVATLTGDETVRYNDLNKWGWTVTDLQGKLGDTVPGTGMTVAQKLLCGLDPTTETKFEPLTITPTSVNTATITFPCEDDTKTGRYRLEAEGGTAAFTGEIAVENGVATAGIRLTLAEGSKVVKFWLKADNSNNSNNGNN